MRLRPLASYVRRFPMHAAARALRAGADRLDAWEVARLRRAHARQVAADRALADRSEPSGRPEGSERHPSGRRGAIYPPRPALRVVEPDPGLHIHVTTDECDLETCRRTGMHVHWKGQVVRSMFDLPPEEQDALDAHCLQALRHAQES